MNAVTRFLSDTARIFMTPFVGLPVVVWLYVVFCFIALPGNPVWRGDLPDPDDYTYLTQTLDWLQGQGWFDNVQRRMMPPDGVALHYTRLAQLPIAAMILFFRCFSLPWSGAALLASWALPLVYLAALLALLPRVALSLVPPEWARLCAYVVICAPILMFKFAPGQVDHHGLELILTLAATGCVLRLFAEPAKTLWPLAAGALYALALAIALETLPWVLAASLVIGLYGAVRAPRMAALFGAALSVTSLLLLPLVRGPEAILSMDLLSYSAAYVALTGGVALALLSGLAVARVASMPARLFLAGAMALVVGGGYFASFPDLLAGPYGAMDKKLAALFFANLEEAQNLFQRYKTIGILSHLILPLLALGVCLRGIKKEGEARKWGWGLLAVLLGASTALACFYQIRVLIYAQLFSVIPLVAFAEQAWGPLARRYPSVENRKRFAAEIALVLLIGPLIPIWLPALQDGRSFNTGLVLFPAQSFDIRCDLNGAEHALNAPRYAARAPLRIVSMIDQGPEWLFRTPHAVLSAPYHTNVRGNLDALAFFSADDDDAARQIVQRDGIDIVALCKNIPDMYFKEPPPHYAVLPSGELRLLPDPSLAARLVAHRGPSWLEEIPVPPTSNILLFEVK